jgi:hypothetical protein
MHTDLDLPYEYFKCFSLCSTARPKKIMFRKRTRLSCYREIEKKIELSVTKNFSWELKFQLSDVSLKS